MLGVLMASVRGQAFMDPAEVVVRNVQAHGRRVVFQLLRKAVGEPRETPRCHANAEVRPLNVGGWDFGWHPGYGITGYRYYGARAVAVRGVLPKVCYRQRLDDDAMGAIAKGAARKSSGSLRNWNSTRKFSPTRAMVAKRKNDEAAN
jgi:hypothetical protein